MGAPEDAPLWTSQAEVNAAANRSPFCIVWSPLPIVTWVLPFIGHMGIATSDGVLCDFSYPIKIDRENLAFGPPTRYIQCDVSLEQTAEWDRSVERGCAIYEKCSYHLCCDNCYSFVAKCLERVEYKGRKRWSMVALCVWMFCCGKYVDATAFIKTWLPFAIVIAGFGSSCDATREPNVSKSTVCSALPAQ